MADVKILNGYDIKDAKALRNKSTTDATSFVDSRAGNGTWPTDGSNLSYSVVIGKGAYIAYGSTLGSVVISGNGAYVTGSNSTAIGADTIASSRATAVGKSASASASYAVAVGNDSLATYTHNVAVGQNARATGGSYSLAIGGNSSAVAANTTAVGATSSASKTGATALGNDARAYAQFSVAVGSSAKADVNATGAIAIGRLAEVSGSASNSIAIGNAAKVIQQNSIQIGQGTNQTYGSVQIRDWQLLNSGGKIPEERLPDGVQFAVDNMPTVPHDFYDSGDDSKQLAVLYKGETVKDENDDNVLVRDLCYRTKISYSRPHFWCSWANENYVPNANKDLIYIDQEKLFLKLAEISRTNIDDDNYAGSYVGGDNSSQDMYFYYDGTNQTWSIEFGSDSVETGSSSTPDTIEGITDLREYGIYITGELNLPEEDNEEIFDVEYYAPIYCDGFDYGDNTFTIDYMKFMNEMCDGDWGFSRVTGSDDNWSYSDGTNTWDMPILPKTYEFNDEEYEDVTIRFEYNFNEDEQEWGWTEYINGEEVWFWKENDFENRFGIIVEHEQDVEHIEFTFRPARQIVWEQFDPVDTSHFCTAAERTSMQGDINRLRHTSFQLVESATDLNTRTTSGAYWIKAVGCTNLPSTASASRDMFLFVTRTDANNVKQVLITDYVNKSSGGTNYGTYCSNMYVRTLSGGTWRSWEVILTPDDLMFLPGFNKTKKQVIGHTADVTNITWQEASGGGSYSEGSGIDITDNVISVDDLDCGTM